MLKKVLLSFFIGHCSLSMAKVGLGFGGITPHYGPDDQTYCNTLDDSGTIYNQIYYLRFSGTESAFTALIGEDSICSPIVGGLYTLLFLGSDHFLEANFTFGAYTHDEEEWGLHIRNAPSTDSPEGPFNINIDGFRMVPVIAFELNLTLARGPGWALKLNNLLSYPISHHSFSMEFSF